MSMVSFGSADASEDQQQAHSLMVKSGFEVLPPDNSEVAENMICQSVAVSAGGITIFFAAFNEFAKSMVAVPAGGDDPLAALKDDAAQAHKSTFAYSIRFKEAITTLGLLPTTLEGLDSALVMER